MQRRIFLIIVSGLFLSLTVPAQTATHPAPLDFDGDGKTDVAVSRIDISVAGNPLFWWIYGSQAEQQLPVIRFGGGGSGHLPIPG